MTTTIAAPYPNWRVETTLPNPEFDDSRATQAAIQIKRRRTDKKPPFVYVQSNDKVVLRATWELSRMKDLELAEFIRVYHTAHWLLKLHDGTSWDVQLIGEPIRRTAVNRISDVGDRLGGEGIQVTMEFSAKQIV